MATGDPGGQGVDRCRQGLSRPPSAECALRSHRTSTCLEPLLVVLCGIHGPRRPGARRCQRWRHPAPGGPSAGEEGAPAAAGASLLWQGLHATAMARWTAAVTAEIGGVAPRCTRELSPWGAAHRPHAQRTPRIVQRVFSDASIICRWRLRAVLERPGARIHPKAIIRHTHTPGDLVPGTQANVPVELNPKLSFVFNAHLTSPNDPHKTSLASVW
jgi:hypothetical protein